MLEFTKEILIVLLRVVTILPILLFTMLSMGKRAIKDILFFIF